MNTVALATTALAQGPSFWHAGTDLLRSKSLDRNSYDSGDWFNRIDWTAHDIDLGLRAAAARPTTRTSGRTCSRCWPTRRWSRRRPIIAARRGRRRAAADPVLLAAVPAGLGRRGSSSASAFPIGGPDQTPGVITMTLDDRAGRTSTPAGRASSSSSTPHRTPRRSVPALAGAAFELHPVQAAGADAVVKTATYDQATGAFTVPARTVAVFTTPSP